MSFLGHSLLVYFLGGDKMDKGKWYPDVQNFKSQTSQSTPALSEIEKRKRDKRNDSDSLQKRMDFDLRK